MFNKVFKLILCIAIFGFSIQQFIGDNIGNGIALIFLSLTFLLLYFKNEILIIAFLRMRKQDFEGTEKWLMKISTRDLTPTHPPATITWLLFYIYLGKLLPYSRLC